MIPFLYELIQNITQLVLIIPHLHHQRLSFVDCRARNDVFADGLVNVDHDSWIRSFIRSGKTDAGGCCSTCAINRKLVACHVELGTSGARSCMKRNGFSSK